MAFKSYVTKRVNKLVNDGTNAEKAYTQAASEYVKNIMDQRKARLNKPGQPLYFRNRK